MFWRLNVGKKLKEANDPGILSFDPVHGCAGPNPGPSPGGYSLYTFHFFDMFLSFRHSPNPLSPERGLLCPADKIC